MNYKVDKHGLTETWKNKKGEITFRYSPWKTLTKYQIIELWRNYEEDAYYEFPNWGIKVKKRGDR